ncbi:MAG: tRNA uridine-5-carboxymethylaminomethyl(34) synthesis GTPase MnmE, partial [Betaproteobacteria bacterium]|nr:tRNA uridine-5-carboxymethylaminomethyl(34) synthesis GTPase MnmE [Betaproteobacteria bacterium]
MLRLSGSDLALWLLPQLGWTLQARRASLRTLKAPDGSAIDQLVALFFPAPHSFTGEDVLELQTHGSPAVIAWAIEALLHYGRDEALRLARPGEFSERAFLNGRLDLAQAEAVADLIAASTRLQARAALRSLQGEFSIQVNQHLEAVQ